MLTILVAIINVRTFATKLIFINKLKTDFSIMKHNLNESYLQSLTEEQRINEMKEWSASEWQQYYCPNGTMSLETFRQKLYNKVDEMILRKYGRDYIK